MHKPVSLFTLTAAIIVAAWWWLGSPVPMPPSPLAPGEKLYCVSYAPFRGAQSPLDLSTKIDARPDRAGPGAIGEGDGLRPHLFRRFRPRPGPGDRATAWPESAARPLGVEPYRPHAVSNQHRRCAGEPVSGRRARNHRRQRGATARGSVAGDAGRNDPWREVAGQDAGDLRRRLGVLAALSRARKRRRFRHDPYPAVLGRRSGRGAGRRGSCRYDPQARGRKFSRQGDRDRRGRLAERRPYARGRAAVACQSGAGHRRRARARQARALPRQRHRGVRSAVEACAGGHRRRPLGSVRRRDAPAEIRLGTAGVKPSALAVAGRRRLGAGGAGVRGCDPCAAAKHRCKRDRARRVDRDCVECGRRRHTGRMDHRECADREF